MVSELREHLQSSLGDSYKIERELGGGGMSYVFVAEEAALGRKVAVKVLGPEFCADISGERFKREILIAARLQHPHIVPVLAVGEAAGLPYYTMPFVAGESLEAKLAREGPLPVREAIRLLSGIARALAYAHRCGVVHRDIKPGNVLVADGTAVVTDFGIAKAILAAREGGGREPLDAPGEADRKRQPTRPDPLTLTGASIGTPAYMAPEQIAADPTTDYRADIYSFGVLAYELLAGRHPFKGPSHRSLLVAHLTATPQSLAELRPELPSELVTLVARCLEKEPADRPASADELVSVLETVGNGDRRSDAPSEDRSRAQAVPAPGVRGGMIPTPATAFRTIVAREAEEAELAASFESATTSRGLIHAVVAEAGLGKTTLVEAFLQRVVIRNSGCRVGRGRCSERLAGAEAYLPFLEALESLLAGSGGAAIARQMRLVAPAWYVQVHLATEPSDTGTPPDTRVGSSEQMKRQLLALLLELTRSGRLVLCLEDVHWADTSTVDLIAYLADRFDALRMLLLVTYRPSDLLLARHAFIEAKLHLQSRGAVRDTHLRPFERQDLATFLDAAYARHEFSDEFVALLHARTEGTPLFVVDLMRQLVHRGVIANRDGIWRLERAIESIESELPASVRSVIQRTIDRLEEADRRLLVAASVQGVEFDSAVIADAIQMPTAEVEERLERLEQVHAIVRFVEERVLASRTPSLRYHFAHILYQNALHATLRATRRMTLGAAVAASMQQYYGEDPAFAGQLGVLYLTARQFEQAAACFLTAARGATQLFGNKEAVLLARHGLGALDNVPLSVERARVELQLQVTLGTALTELLGYAAPEVEAAYSRARVLCSTVGDAPTQVSVLHGLYRFYTVRGQLHTAREVVEELITVAEATGDPRQIVIAHSAMGPPLIHLGEFETALQYLEAELAAYDAQKEGGGDRMVYGAFMPAAWIAVGLWLLGRPQEALEKSRLAREIADRRQYPFAVAYAQSLTAWLQQYRGDAAAVKYHAEAAIEVARTHDYVQWLALGFMFRAWALVALGDHEAGLAQLARGIEGFRRTGAELNLPHFLSLLADAHRMTGNPAAGLHVIEEAIGVAEKNDDRCWEPELHRLKGELLLQLAEDTDGEVAGPQDAAEAAFRRALDVAARQKSRSLELRAAVSLARLLSDQHRLADARDALARALDHYPQDTRTSELDEARAAVETLDGFIAADL
jgi:predicted ATPase